MNPIFYSFEPEFAESGPVVFAKFVF